MKYLGARTKRQVKTDRPIRYWIIGSGGQIGRGLREVIEPQDVYQAPRAPWHDAHALASYFTATAGAFADHCGDDPWAILWVAGAAVVGTSPASAEQEIRSFTACLEAVRGATPAGVGAFFLGSSAGGVYAGSSHPPFGLTTQTAPVSPYGRLKLAQEEALHAHLGGRSPLIVGRIANVYGPTQNVVKAQGLITQLCRAAAMRMPVKVYVPGSTLRDYIYIRDVSIAITALVQSAIRQEGADALEIIATGQSISVSSLIGLAQMVTHRRIPVAFGDSPLRGHQPRDLTLEPSPSVRKILDPPTPLAVGIRRTYESLVTQRLSSTPS